MTHQAIGSSKIGSAIVNCLSETFVGSAEYSAVSRDPEDRTITMSSWYEVWVDEGLEVPYVLIVQPVGDEIRVTDPKANGKVAYSAKTYEQVKMWLLEDEYVRVTGR